MKTGIQILLTGLCIFTYTSSFGQINEVKPMKIEKKEVVLKKEKQMVATHTLPEMKKISPKVNPNYVSRSRQLMTAPANEK